MAVHLIASHCVDNSAGARKYIIIIVSKTVCIPFGDATAPLKRKDAKMLYTGRWRWLTVFVTIIISEM